MNYVDRYQRPKKQRRSHKAAILTFILVVGLVGAYVSYALQRTLPTLLPSSSALNLRSGTGVSQLTWPTSGQSAVAVEHTNIIQTHGTQTPVAIASTAKVITALVVMQKQPIKLGQAGPTITLTDADAALYNSYVSQEGSVVPVSAGEQITEYQMLEALMLPSSNNLADSLAIWAFGSLDAYKAGADQYLLQLGLHDTHVGSDASGFSPSTTSTAHDLVIIGKLAMDDPVLRQIVGMASTTDIPQLGSVRNVNSLLGSNNIIGIKTGNTDQAGGVYLSASTRQVDSQSLTIITALVGAPTLSAALNDSLPLVTSAQANIVTTRLLAKHAIIGEYRQPWGGIIPAAAQTELTTPAWRGSTATAHVSLQPLSPSVQAGQVVGNASTPKTSFGTAKKTDIILLQTPTKPSTWWRLLHPLD